VGNSIKVRVPNSSGTLPVTVVVDNVMSNSVPFTYLQNIVAASLNQTSPVLRNVSGIDAATVVIKGSNFGTDASKIRVTVGGQNAQVTSVDDANVTFLSPSHHSSLPNQQQIKVFHQNIEASYPNGNLMFTYLEPTILSTTCTIVPIGNGLYQMIFGISGNHFNATAPNANFQLLIDGVNYGWSVNGNTAAITTVQNASFIKNRYDIRVNNKWGSFISAFQRNVTISNFDFTFNNNQRIVTITGEGFGSTVDLSRSIRVYRMDGSTKVYLNVGAITSWTDNQLTTTFTDTYIDDRTYGVEVRVNSRNATREKFLNYQQVN
ncbi:MAG: IPT/TIG domain-containing protein, partial [Pedobacter sp.]